MSPKELGTRCGHCAESRAAIAAHCPPLHRRYAQSRKAIAIGIDAYGCVGIVPRHRTSSRWTTPEPSKAATSQRTTTRGGQRASVPVSLSKRAPHLTFRRGHPRKICRELSPLPPTPTLCTVSGLKCQGSHRLNNDGCQHCRARESSALPQSLSHQLNAAYDSSGYPPQTELAARRWREPGMHGGLLIAPRISALSFRITHAGITLGRSRGRYACEGVGMTWPTSGFAAMDAPRPARPRRPGFPAVAFDARPPTRRSRARR